MDLTGRVALVAGGASGIGAASALALARAGADVALTYWSSEAGANEVVTAIRSSGRRALAVKADMTDPAVPPEVVERVEAELGPIDILFANTGGMVKRVPIADATLGTWNEILTLNYTATFLVCQAVLRKMKVRGCGAIVTMSSLAGFDGGGPGACAYAASKGAVSTFTRGLAKEAAAFGVRVNAVAPGLIGTRFHDVFSTAESRKAMVDKTPLKREGQPEDVAEAVVFLASERAAFITGEVLNINGGLGMV